MRDDEVPPQTRVAAINALLDRAWMGTITRKLTKDSPTFETRVISSAGQCQAQNHQSKNLVPRRVAHFE